MSQAWSACEMLSSFAIAGRAMLTDVIETLSSSWATQMVPRTSLARSCLSEPVSRPGVSDAGGSWTSNSATEDGRPSPLGCECDGRRRSVGVVPRSCCDCEALRSVVVEDEAGPRIAAGETASAAEQQIDLGAFYHEFIRPGRGNADITAETEGPEAKARLAHLLGMIERNGPF